MAWVAFDCDTLEHPKLVALPSDSARLGFVATILKAKRLPQPGRFASAAHFRAVMGRYARYLKDYVEVRLLDEAPDGSLSVHDWSDYQRDKADSTAAERQRRFRERHAESRRDVTDAVTPLHNASPARARAVAVAVDVPVSDSEEHGTLRGRDETTPEMPVLRWLANAKAGRQPVGKVALDLMDLVERNGATRVIAAMEELGAGLDTAQYVYGARNSLHPIPSGRRMTEAERKAQEQADVVSRAKRGELRVAPG